MLNSKMIIMRDLSPFIKEAVLSDRDLSPFIKSTRRFTWQAYRLTTCAQGA